MMGHRPYGGMGPSMIAALAVSLVWVLIGFGVTFLVVYEAVYLAVRRALREVPRPERAEAPPLPPQ